MYALVRVDRLALPPIRLELAGGATGIVRIRFAVIAKTESRIDLDIQTAAARANKNLYKGQWGKELFHFRFAQKDC
ncbi:MAG: hypothetical protein PHI97_24350 [Desulfobulbus sp.]|nr:hypothetical protein [Desulfobulbus sp.]